MKKNFLLATFMLCTFSAISQCALEGDLYRYCDPDSVNMRNYEQWYLLPAGCYFTLDIFSGENTETIQSLRQRNIYLPVSGTKIAQPYRVDDTISIAGVSGYIYIRVEQDPLAYEIRDSLLENILAQVEIPYNPSMNHTPGYTELFFDHPINVCGKFYVVVKKNQGNDKMYVSSAGPNDPDMYPLATIMGNASTEWMTTGVYGSYDGSLVGDTMKMVYLFPIIADSAYMHNDDTTSTDTTSGFNTIDIERFTHIFPNPTNDVADINCGFKMQQIQVYNSAGALVEEYKPEAYNYKIDLRSHPEGAYMIKITTARGSATKKIIKQ